MRKVYSSQYVNLVYFARSVLEGNKIGSVVMREQLIGAVGGLAPIDTWPELWIHEDDDLEHARELINSAMKISETHQTHWLCPGCGQNIEPQFTKCWQCNTERTKTEI